VEVVVAEEVVAAGAGFEVVTTSAGIVDAAGFACGAGVEIERVAGFDLGEVGANPAVEGAKFETLEICIFPLRLVASLVHIVYRQESSIRSVPTCRNFSRRIGFSAERRQRLIPYVMLFAELKPEAQNGG
jgi:hypothetical protein